MGGPEGSVILKIAVRLRQIQVIGGEVPGIRVELFVQRGEDVLRLEHIAPFGIAYHAVAAAGEFSLSDAGGEVQARGVIQAVQYQGAATRFELKLAGGEKLLVSQANLTGEMLPSTLSPGQQVMASWSRDVMVPLVEER